MVAELCGEFIGADHTTIHRLIARFGLGAVALDRETAGRAGSLMYFLGRHYDADELAADLQALAPLVRRQVQEAGFPTTHARFTEAGRRLDHLSAHTWIERHVAGGHAAPFAIAAAMLLLLFLGIHNAWDIVTYIVVERLPTGNGNIAQRGHGGHGGGYGGISWLTRVRARREGTDQWTNGSASTR